MSTIDLCSAEKCVGRPGGPRTRVPICQLSCASRTRRARCAPIGRSTRGNHGQFRTTDTGLACAEAEHRRLAHVLLSRGSRRERDAPCHRQREVPSHSRKRRQQRHGQRNPAGQRGYPAFLVDSVASNGCGGTGIKDISFPPGSSVSTTLKVTGKSPGSYAPGTRKNTVTVDASLQS